MKLIKPPHASPEHPAHAAYDAELDDYPEIEAAIEEAWQNTGGINAEGQMWLTPRMHRNSATLVAAWMKESCFEISKAITQSQEL